MPLLHSQKVEKLTYTCYNNKNNNKSYQTGEKKMKYDKAELQTGIPKL